MEAIKKAVEVRLGAAFMSRAVVEKEIKLGLLAVLHIEVKPGSTSCVLKPLIRTVSRHVFWRLRRTQAKRLQLSHMLQLHVALQHACLHKLSIAD